MIPAENRRKQMSRLKILKLVIVLTTLGALQGCAFVVGAAAGGAAGYTLREQGYHVRAPVTKEQR
jgi:hypothetical protein